MTNDKQRDKLVELIDKAEYDYLEFSKIHPYEKSLTDFTADYLLANGVIVPPCRVGDTAYFLIEDSVVGKKYISPEPIVDVCTKGFYTSGHKDSDENGDLWLWSDVGVIVFFDKKEAEAKLKEGVQG